MNKKMKLICIFTRNLQDLQEIYMLHTISTIVFAKSTPVATYHRNKNDSDTTNVFRTHPLNSIAYIIIALFA